MPLDPEVPELPDVPEEPEVPEVPEEPDVPEVPDVPELPELPEEPSPPVIPDKFTHQSAVTPVPGLVTAMLTTPVTLLYPGAVTVPAKLSLLVLEDIIIVCWLV